MPKPREVIQSFVYGILFALGMILVILGTLTIVVGVFFFLNKCWGYEAATPLWTGGFFLITGITACSTTCCKESRCSAKSLFTLCVIAAVFSLMLGAHGWLAATMEYESTNCDPQGATSCASLTGRISLDISMVVLAILVFEIVILMAIVTYFLIEGGPIGPFEKIQGLPIGKKRSDDESSRFKSKKKSTEEPSAEEEEPMVVTSSSPTDYKLNAEPPPMPYDPDYATADELDPVKPDSTHIEMTEIPQSQSRESSPGELKAIPVEYTMVQKPTAQTAVVTSVPPPEQAAVVGAAATVQPEPEPEPEPVTLRPKKTDSDADSDEFVQPLSPSNLNESGPYPPLKPQMDIVRQSLLLRASSSEESIPSADTSSESSANSSPRSTRSETSPAKKSGSPASKGSGSSTDKSKSSSYSSISDEASGKQHTIV